MTVRRYVLMNLGVASLSGVVGYPFVLAWELVKRYRKKSSSLTSRESEAKRPS